MLRALSLGLILLTCDSVISAEENLFEPVPAFVVRSSDEGLWILKKLGFEFSLSQKVKVPSQLASRLLGTPFQGEAEMVEAKLKKGTFFLLIVPGLPSTAKALKDLIIFRTSSLRALKEKFPQAKQYTLNGRAFLCIQSPEGRDFWFEGPLTEGILLFNGKDLSGWHTFRKGKWFVEEGALVGEQGERYQGGWLVSDEKFEDFVLTFSFKISERANSGVCVRYPGEGPPPKVGVEIQLSEADPDYKTGSLLGIKAASSGFYRRGWNQVKIIVKGKTVTSFLNGKKAAEAEVERIPRTGHIALQIHGGPKYSGTFVMFKDLELFPLSEASSQGK